MYDKFKGLLADDGFFYGVVLVLVALSSFGLGRISQSDLGTQHKASSIQFAEHEASAAVIKTASSSATAVGSSTTYVGSKNGTKFHLPWCPGASHIKEENRIYFSSKAEALASGYTPASNCKGI